MPGLVNDDAEGFEVLAEAFGLPSGTIKETALGAAAIQAKLQKACEVPWHIMRRLQAGTRLRA